MKENNVLIPEIYASYPYDGKILEYYQGVLNRCISFCIHFIKRSHWNWNVIMLKRGLKKMSLSKAVIRFHGMKF